MTFFWLIAISIWVFALGLPFLDWSAKREARWNDVKATHLCKLVERWAGNVGTDEQGSKTAYVCNDGVKYRR